MSELSDLFRPLVDRVPPGPSVEELTGRVVRRRRRRRVRRAAGASIAVAVAVVAAVTLGTRNGSVHKIIVGNSPPATVDIGPAMLPGIVGPPGAQVVSYGNASMLVPSSWTLQEPTVCAGDQSFSEINPGPGYSPPGSCIVPPAMIPAHYARLRDDPTNPNGSQLQPQPTVTFNGHRATVSRCAPTANCTAGLVTFAFPDLGVHLRVDAADAKSIASTIRFSPRYLVLAAQKRPVTIPPDWSTVTYDGIQVRVPASWPVRQLGNSHPGPDACGSRTFFAAPVVDVGPGTNQGLPCQTAYDLMAPVPPRLPVVDGVWIHPSIAPLQGGTVLRAVPTRVLLAPSTRQTAAPAALNSPALPLLVLVTTNSQGQRIELDVGLGNNPVIAAAIIASINQSP